MPSAWRLTKTRYLATAWDGEGARTSGGRWTSVGTAVVYTSATLSLALVETLVHVPSGVLPAYTAVPIEFDDSLVTGR
jgi:RES domain-containing protein